MKTVDYHHQASDGKQIYVHRWLPEAPSRAAVIIAHGMAEHGERYSAFALELARRGWEVHAPDHRGHGKTSGEGERGWFAERDGFRRVVDDLGEIAAGIVGAREDYPLFLFGHCMGSLVALAFAGIYGRMLSGCVLAGVIEEPAGAQIAIGKLLSAMGCLVNGQMQGAPLLDDLAFRKKNRAFEPARTAFDWLSRDPREVDAYAADPLCGFICSYGFFRDLFAGFDLVYGASGLIGSIPPSLAFYVAAGAEDPMGGARGAVGKLERRLRAAGSGRVTTRLYPGARHELLKETNRDEAIGDIVAWLEGALEPEVAAPGVGAAEPARPRG